jgi:two-component system, OmpR family, response regulator
MSTPQLAQKRVLVVDDDRALRHAVLTLLHAAGFAATAAADGASALARMAAEQFDLIILDLGLPRISGLDVLSEIQKMAEPPKVIVVTADDTPGTVIQAIRDRAYEYIVKPAPPKTIVELVERAFVARPLMPIEVVSGRGEWLELLVPCDLQTVERIQGFVGRLDAGLPEDVRDSIGHAFRELLMNAVEWGGKFDPSRTVRIACLRTRRMILYRIADPGPGFSLEQVEHAAINNKPDEPCGHIELREKKGLRPGGFGLLMARSLVDELIWNEAHNEVVFVKYL